MMPTHRPKSYENPFLTATSRSIIADIQRMSRQFSSVDVPQPLTMFYTLFCLEIRDRVRNPAQLSRALRSWTEMGDISETESFGEAYLIHHEALVGYNKCSGLTSCRYPALLQRTRLGHDFWDVKDVAGLVPAVSLAQWIVTRLPVKEISYMFNLSRPKKTFHLCR